MSRELKVLTTEIAMSFSTHGRILLISPDPGSKIYYRRKKNLDIGLITFVKLNFEQMLKPISGFKSEVDLAPICSSYCIIMVDIVFS